MLYILAKIQWPYRISLHQKSTSDEWTIVFVFLSNGTDTVEIFFFAKMQKDQRQLGVMDLKFSGRVGWSTVQGVLSL